MPNRRLRQLASITCVAFYLAACSSGGEEGGTTQAIQTWTLGAPTYYTTFGDNVGQTVIGDLNGDGRNDLATSNGEVLFIHYQDSNGALSSLFSINSHQHFDIEISRIALGDLNADGKQDIVIMGRCLSGGCQTTYEFIVLYQDPQTGQLAPGRALDVSATRAFHAAIGDINSDDRDDLVIVTDENRLSIFYQNATGGLERETIYDNTFVIRTGPVRICDMDNDGDKDIVVQSGLKQLAIIKQDSTVNPSILDGTPDYYSIQTSFWPQIHTFEVGDLNGDGRNDVVTNDPASNGYLNILFQNSSGTLDPAVLIPVFSSALYGIEIADVNGDGLNDIAGEVVDPGLDLNGKVYVFHQKADHSFGNPITYRFTTRSGGGSQEYDALSFGDVTGDGRPDAVVTWWPDKLLVVLPGIPS